MTFSNYFARDTDDVIPLIGDAYVPAAPDDVPQPAPTPLCVWRVVAVVWYAIFAGILGGSIIMFLSYPPAPGWPSAWPEYLIGSASLLTLLAITRMVRWLARTKC
jgi:hypothetical protein